MKEKILVVDDDRDILNFIKLDLESKDYVPFLCATVEEAIKELKNHQFECAIIDIVMGPNKTSDELIKFLKNTSTNILNFDLPMIIISAHVNDDLRVRMISKDPLIVDAIKKPLTKNQISNKIQDILSSQSEADEELDVIFRPFEDQLAPKKEEVPRPQETRDIPDKKEEAYNEKAMQEAGINKLMFHCFNGDYNGLQEELIKNPEASLLSRSLDGKTCIHYGARGGNQELIDFLLVSGLKINDRDKKGREPLYEAVMAQDFAMCEHLISHEARLSSKFDDKTYLMIAATVNNFEIFELLLKEGVNPSLTDADGKTVKVYLKENKQNKFLEALKKFGV
ncbi:MAG: hypothetical protein CME70_15295 [Halobacteriovorax sp.]|nr:hypothetical protein [Halobacteriovorax sp.]|tara:strand:- start:70101 stop:71114 length:1014 start_codon:yes stop_codon:yes gene_type:complete